MLVPRLLTLVIIALVISGGARAARAQETAAPRARTTERVTLEELVERSLRSSRANMARADTEAARARADEARAARLPTLAATGFLAPSPVIRCVDPGCTRTEPEDLAIRIGGVFGGASIRITQPLYTSGRLTAVRGAADAGIAAQVALERATEGDLRIEAARAYWGLKLARELVAMLEEGIADVEDARARLVERLEEGTGEATVQDRQRIDTLLAEARIRLAEARAAEATALAGVRAIVGPGGDAIDIDDAPLAAVDAPLPEEAALVAEATARRAEVRAADAGARAAARLAELEGRAWWPNVALVGQLEVRRAQGVDEAPSAVYAEPFHDTSVGVAVAVEWNLEPWTTRARVRRARAEERRADELADLARTGAAMDARVAAAEARGARAQLDAAIAGEEAARGWVAAVLQADAIGTAETRDLADAYLAWFQMRARLASAIFAWNVASERVVRATH